MSRPDERANSRPRSSGAISNAPYRRIPWMPASGIAMRVMKTAAATIQLSGKSDQSAKAINEAVTTQVMTRVRVRTSASPKTAR